MWITILAQKDSEGFVHNTIAGLAKDAELTMEEARPAIHVLESEDPDSTSQEEGGRRIKPLPGGGGWQVVNHWKYRDEVQKIRSDNARRQRAKRARDKAANAQQFPQSAPPTPQEAKECSEFERGERKMYDLGAPTTAPSIREECFRAGI